MQACRGTALDEGTMVTHDAKEDDKTYRIPLEADFLYCYSTVPGIGLAKHHCLAKPK